jgi:hypothetical protein
VKTDKTGAQVRGDILADIEAVRLGKMDMGRAAVIFAGYKVMNDTFNTEINAAKLAIAAKATGHEFMKVVRMGRLVMNGEDGDDTPRIAA